MALTPRGFCLLSGLCYVSHPFFPYIFCKVYVLFKVVLVGASPGGPRTFLWWVSVRQKKVVVRLSIFWHGARMQMAPSLRVVIEFFNTRYNTTTIYSG